MLNVLQAKYDCIFKALHSYQNIPHQRPQIVALLTGKSDPFFLLLNVSTDTGILIMSVLEPFSIILFCMRLACSRCAYSCFHSAWSHKYSC